MHLHIGDGVRFVREHRDEFDVIIVDSTDPVGPGEALFGEEFYRDARNALHEDGIIISQAESIYLFPKIVQRLCRITRELFVHQRYGMIAVPTYPTGSIGFCLASKKHPVDRPVRLPDAELAGQLRYYTPEVHHAALQLPAFAARWFA